MAYQKRPRKPLNGTGLLRGQPSIIARIHRCSLQHVLECARGRRKSAKVLRTIEAYRERNAAQQQEQQPAA